MDIASGSKPAKIILAGRSEAKITPVIEEMRKANSSVQVTFVQVDLANNASVRAAAKKIKELTSSVDILVNCAGVMGVREFTKSPDGVEMHFAANHLGHFLLTNLLVDELAAEKGHVVNVSSMGYLLGEVDTEDPNFDVSANLPKARDPTNPEPGGMLIVCKDGKLYNAWIAYARSKTANILFSHSLAEKFKARGITSVAADPGSKLPLDHYHHRQIRQAHLTNGKWSLKRNSKRIPAWIKTS
jgi:NAD(P)-dependent dehydrogenase (short-subunit alcohol dehydrogenase family)